MATCPRLELRPEVAKARDEVARVAVQQAVRVLPSFKVDATEQDAYSAFRRISSARIHQYGSLLSLPVGFNGFTQAWPSHPRGRERVAEAARSAAERTVKSELYNAFINLEKVSSPIPSRC